MSAPTPTPPLAAESVTVEYGGVRVLDRVSFSAGPGCLMGVVGPNGAGKSTLFNVITALTPASSGRVLIHGKPMAEMRGTVAYVPQYEKLNPRIPMSAWEVVMLGRVRRIGWLRRAGRADRDAAGDALRRVGMWERRKSLINELSGGQRQRVFLARALAQGADILLLDEAFSGVDIASQSALMSVLTELRDDGRTIMLSSHDINHMAHYCDECLCLNCNVCACGPPREVLTEDVMLRLYGPLGGVPFHGHGLAGDDEGHHHPEEIPAEPTPAGQTPAD